MTDGGRERGPLDFDDEDRAGEGHAPAEPSAAAEPSAPASASPAAAARRPPSGAARRAPSAKRPPSGMRDYVWVVGVAACVLIAVLFVTTLRHGTDRGARGIPVGERMPDFAVPLATGGLEGDANLAVKAGQGAKHAACSLRGPEVLNGCALRDAGPVVLAFFTVRNGECVAQVDTMQRVQAQVPGVRLVAIAIRGDRDTVRRMVARHRWTIPVGYDADGALSNAFHAQVCPQLTFARAGGRVAETTFGTLGAAALTAKARRLAAP
jgi:peroxiredoxin